MSVPKTQDTEELSLDKIICRDYIAASVEEYLEILMFLSDWEKMEERERTEKDAREKGESQRKKNDIPRLWYRGEQREHPLLPSLFRGKKSPLESGYNQNHAREDFRYQHFRAKCNQLITSFPDSKFEWMELMQHHLLSTRLMDWSESAITALMFSVEPFMNPDRNDRDLSYRRSTITPTVWVLNPLRLNRKIYQSFQDNDSKVILTNHAFHDVLPIGISGMESQSFLQGIRERLSEKKRSYFLDETDCAIVCLSVIESDRQANAGRLFRLLQNDEFNPYFYLLLRYYHDGLPVPTDLLPPLAIVHPYHSQRIQAQHGVFTVFPHYMQSSDKEDQMAMNRHPLAEDCLYRIRIVRPSRIAEELLEMGERLTALYPELPRYTKDIEAEASYML